MSWEEPPTPVLSFEEWVGIITSFESGDDRWSDRDELFSIPPRVITQYLTRLLTNAHALCAHMNSPQIEQMIWFFNGVRSSYWHDVRSTTVPKEDQAAAVRALGNFYRAFLDPFFNTAKGLTYDPATWSPSDSGGEAAGAVYMMWDMDCLEGAAMFRGEEHLVDPIFEVLGTALRCETAPCHWSALHGLGHLETYHPARVHAEIDWALNQPGHLNKLLREYAHQARTGSVL